MVKGQSVELVIVVHSCDEDTDTRGDARGVAELVDAGLDEEFTEALCEVGIVNSDERRLGRVPSVEMRVSDCSLVWLLLEAP